MMIAGIRVVLVRRALVLFVVTIGMLGSAGVASAASFTVNDQNDYALTSSNSTTCATSDSSPSAPPGTTAGTCTLRGAVQAADNTGGANTIRLPAGTYKLTIVSTGTNDPSTGDLDVNNNANGTSITITGAGSSSSVINANQVDRAFTVHPNGGLTLSGMTIENGSPSDSSTDGYDDGGAIDSHGALTVTGDVVFRGNGAYFNGGAIYSSDDTNSSLALTGARFEGNSTYGDLGEYYGGGAIFDESPKLTTISKSSFSGNTMEYYYYGGAIFAYYSGGMNISSSTFSRNTTYYYGGAIAWYGDSDLTVTNSTFSQNAGYYGGAVYTNYAAGMTFTGDRFLGNASDYGALDLDSSSAQYTFDQDELDANTSSYEGGGIYWGAGSLDVHSSSFVGNNGGYMGGAILDDCDGCSLTLVNSTLSHNSGLYAGGIGFDEPAPAAINNDTIAFNSAGGYGDTYAAGGGVYNAKYVTAAGYVPPTGSGFEAPGVENTIVAENSDGDCDDKGSDEFTLAAEPFGHNMDSDKSCFNSGAPGDRPGVDPHLGQPADNGGPLAGDPNTGQSTLLTDSDLGGPAVDAGTNTGCTPTDERGVTRDDDPCDIGAYESVAATLGESKAAPSSAKVGNAFDYTITVKDNGPAPATGTKVTDQLPAHTTLYGVTASQGSCAPTTGSSPKVTCSLGVLNDGASATVTMVVSVSKKGSVTNTATASDNEGSHVDASATTKIKPASPGAKPKAITRGANKVTTSSATIHGKVKPGGQATSYFFQYGTSSSLGMASPVRRTGTYGKKVKAALNGLLSGTVYYYRLVATNDSGTSYGKTKTFKTKGTAVAAARAIRPPQFTG